MVLKRCPHIAPSRRLSLLAATSLALLSAPAGAPPPVTSFPAELAPSGGEAPPNSLVWAFGQGAPDPSAIGVVVTVEGTPRSGSLVRLGCCGAAWAPDASFVAGDVVSVTFSTAGGERSASFTVAGDVDTTPPTLLPPGLLDERDGALTLGVEGTDDVALAGFVARAGGVLLSAAPEGFALEIPSTPGCLDVVALDLAGNESEPYEICPRESEPDAGPAPPPESCASSCAWLPLLFIRRWRRQRIGGAR